MQAGHNGKIEKDLNRSVRAYRVQVLFSCLPPKRKSEQSRFLNNCSHFSENRIAEELRRAATHEAAQQLAVWEKPTPALVAVDPAAKTFLMQNYAERRENFVFPETAQTRFASLTKGQFDKLYRISGRNALADEVQKSGCADYFYNAREMFHICKRCGANPTRLPEAPLDSLGLEAVLSDYDEVLCDVAWQVGGHPERIVLPIAEQETPAMICHNPAQLKEALLDETVRIIRVNA